MTSAQTPSSNIGEPRHDDQGKGVGICCPRFEWPRSPPEQHRLGFSTVESSFVKKKRLPSFKQPCASRSRNMRAIRSTGNKTTERRLISLMLHSGLSGWSVRSKGVPGAPDFVFARRHLAVFSDGCFFHGFPRCGHIPRTNAAYWKAKIARNRRRDARISRTLRSLGYSVIRIWECQLRKRPEWCLKRMQRLLLDRRHT